jgi:formylglycine-generating enzyme required for sulfatase activity
MGSSQAEQDAMDQSRPDKRPVFNSGLYSRKGESPQHRVNVPAFLLARTEVTQKLWRGLAELAGLPEAPSFFKNAGDRAPVEQVSWDDVTKWIQAINKAHGLSLRLPTEAEWEYACRAGTTTPIYNGKMTILGHCNSPELDEIGWYMGNSGVDYAGGVDSARWVEKQYKHTRAGTHPVGKKKANAFGLCDMIGNVMEWCEDHAHANYIGAPADGSAWIGGNWIPGSAVNGPLSTDDSQARVTEGKDVPGRIRRGGSWRQLTYNIRSAMRSFRGPSFSDSNHGFRVAAPAPAGARGTPQQANKEKP